MKLEVGIYIRTKNGNIRKIVEVTDTKFVEEPDCYVDKVLINIEQNPIEDTIYMENWLFNEEIVKSSPNIIDLIEVGDMVNSLIVAKISEDNETKKKYINLYGSLCEWENEDIKSIVTKEQFSQMEYKVVE